MNDETVAKFIELADKQNENIALLTKGFEEMAENIERRPTKRAVSWLAAVVAAVVLSLSLGLNYATLDSSHRSLDRIESCTTPEGECTKRGAESQVRAVANIVCNQEKVVYFLDDEYKPYPYCAEFINFEIDRVGLDTPRLTVDPDVEQYGLHKQ